MAAKLDPRTSSNQTLAKYTMAITVMITGVPAHRIRRFEHFGICTPARSQSGQRLFSDSDLELIKQVSALEKDGINLPGVRVIMMLRNNSSGLSRSRR
jgi:MerR family transcriptional regulator/heat shock protein HspR